VDLGAIMQILFYYTYLWIYLTYSLVDLSVYRVAERNLRKMKFCLSIRCETGFQLSVL